MKKKPIININNGNRNNYGGRGYRNNGNFGHNGGGYRGGRNGYFAGGSNNGGGFRNYTRNNRGGYRGSFNASTGNGQATSGRNIRLAENAGHPQQVMGVENLEMRN